MVPGYCIFMLPLTIAVIDHGIASIEIVMEEALQDIPPLVFDIQERLRGMQMLTDISELVS